MTDPAARAAALFQEGRALAKTGNHKACEKFTQSRSFGRSGPSSTSPTASSTRVSCAGAAVVYFTAPRKRETTVVPVVGPSSVGVAVGRSF